MNTSTLSRLRDHLKPLGQLSYVIALIGTVIVPLSLLPLVTSTQFASDFETGTHSADYSIIPVCTGFAIATVVGALIGCVLAGPRARSICGVILVPPVLLVLNWLGSMPG